MPFVGTLPPAVPGERKPCTIDFADSLAPGDFIISATSKIECLFGVDANVALLLPPDAPVIDGTLVTQTIGFGDGFQRGLIYRWAVTTRTASRAALVSWAHLPCYAAA